VPHWGIKKAVLMAADQVCRGEGGLKQIAVPSPTRGLVEVGECVNKEDELSVAHHGASGYRENMAPAQIWINDCKKYPTRTLVHSTVASHTHTSSRWDQGAQTHLPSCPRRPKNVTLCPLQPTENAFLDL
jgi:hypothetical protein